MQRTMYVRKVCKKLGKKGKKSQQGTKQDSKKEHQEITNQEYMQEKHPKTRQVKN